MDHKIYKNRMFESLEKDGEQCLDKKRKIIPKVQFQGFNMKIQSFWSTSSKSLFPYVPTDFPSL